MPLKAKDKNNIFWDTAEKFLDKEKHREFVVAMVLEHGNIKQKRFYV